MSDEGRRAIVFASEYYPPFAPGGAEWTNAEWAKALARRGHRVVVVTPNYGFLSPRERAAGVDVIRVPFPLKLGLGQVEADWRAHRHPLWTLYFATRIARVARTQDARVIHAQGKRALVSGWLAARALRRPVLATVRDLGLACPLGSCALFEPWTTFDCSIGQYVSKCIGFQLAHYHPRAGRARRVGLEVSALLAWLGHLGRRRTLGRLDGIVGVSRGILDAYPPRAVPPDRRHVVYPLPPTVGMPSPEDVARVRRDLGIGAGPLVLSVGKLSLGKGTRVLVAALDRIRAAVPHVRFVFAGKGDLRLPERDDLHALGVLQHDRLFPLYRAADVVVSPSVWPEPLSRVIIEAMHFGRPVVATAVGGSPEAVEDGVTGLLVPKADPVALADAIVVLLRHPARRERMGAAAQARVAAVFSEDKIVAALLDAYAAASRRTV
jgi:glycosyltransferase involved in cell wall biosynthesis